MNGVLLLIHGGEIQAIKISASESTRVVTSPSGDDLRDMIFPVNFNNDALTITD